MATAEKLFVEIFDRKNWIIDRVKQQTDSCNQLLASKLLAEGITPPSWLLSPNSASDSQELNKDELVSKLLRPYPQPSVCSVARYPLYNNVVVGADDGGLSGGAFLENLAFSKVLNWQNDTTVPAISREDHVGCAVNPVPEPDTSVNSPEDLTEERILSIFTAPDHSLAGIQRSKSRQKALELRSSAKMLGKSGLNHEFDLPNQIRFSLSASKEAGQGDLRPELAQPCITDGQNGKDGNSEADCQDKGKGTEVYSGRITRSRSYANAPVSARGSLPLGCSTADREEHGRSDVAKVREERSPYVCNSQQVDNCVIKFQKPAGQSNVSCQSRRSRLDGEDGFSKDKETDVYASTSTRSKASSKRRSCASDSSKSDSSSDEYPIIDTVMDNRDDLLPDCIKGSLLRVDPANALNRNCETRESILEDCRTQWEKNAVPLSSGHLATYVNELPDPDISSHSAQADCNTASSRGRSVIQISDSNEVKGLVKTPVESYGRVTESQSFSDDNENYEPVNRSENLSFRARIDTAVDNRDDLLSDRIEASLVSVDTANAQKGGCEALESVSEGCKTHREKNVVPRSSGHFASGVDELPDLEISSHSAKADCNTDSSHGRSALQIRVSNELQGLVKTPVELYGRVTESQYFSDDKEKYESVNRSENLSFSATVTQSISSSKQKSSANDELQNSGSCQQILPCDGTHGMLNEQGTASLFMASELVLHDHAGQSGNSSSGKVKQGIEFESQASFPPLDPFTFVEPKQSHFNEAEEGNMRTFTSNSGKGRLDNLPRKAGCSLSDVAVSLDEGAFDDTNQLCVGKQSPEMSDISSKEEEVLGDSFESDVQENPDTHVEKYGPVAYQMSKSSQNDPDDGEICKSFEAQKIAYMPDIRTPMKYGPVLKDSLETDAQENLDTHVEKYEPFVREYTMSKNSPDDPEDRQICKNFEAQPKAYMPDILHPMKFHSENVQESLPEPRVEEDGCSGERNDKKHVMSNHQGCENLTPTNCLNSVKQPRAEMYDRLIEKVQMANPISHSLDKIKQFSVQESQILSCLEGEVSIQHADSPVGDNGLLTCGTVRSHGKTLSPERRSSHTSQNTWPQIKRRKIEHKAHNFTTPPSFRATKHHSSQKGPASTFLENMEINVDTVLMDTFDLSKITDVEISHKMDPNLRDGTKPPFLSTSKEVEFSHEKDEHTNLSSVINNERLGEATALSMTDNVAKSSVVQGIESHKSEGGSPSEHSAHNKDLELSDIDQYMPVFEEFLVDAQADSGELDVTADGIDFNKLNLTSSTVERASILAEICRSSLVTPLSHFSPAFKYHGTQVPNGGTESLDLRSALPSSSDVDEQLQSGNSLADHYKKFLEPMPYSDCLAYSGARYGWSSRNQHASPVGKLWERLSSHSGSSEKHSVSNPELTCFPIEEDPSSSEENKTADENADDVQKEIDSSLANSYDKRQPLKNLSNLGIGTNGIKKAKESINSSISRPNLSNKTSLKRQLSLKESSRNNIVSNVSSKESINNSISRPNSSKKTSLKRQLSLKESSRNNIVSNVSSFIPLVHQKQAEAACAGKRDVKVKALEAAEAAKRLEEKRANERKMRKEAMKLERAKLEEKNLRHMELEKKRKEEERKKKDADIIAKKRLREEEERKEKEKEKEKKRMRLESRQQQRGQEEKMLADKAQKETQRPKDGRMNSKKELHNERKRQQNGKIIKEDEVAPPRAEAKLTSTDVVMDYEESGNSGQCCEAGKAIHPVNITPQKEDLTVQENKGKSYEISPYCSDDEDEEEDEIPAKKYIPSWASKISVALLLPLQQKMDPDTIFLPESFDVLLPRKLQQKGAV